MNMRRIFVLMRWNSTVLIAKCDKNNVGDNAGKYQYGRQLPSDRQQKYEELVRFWSLPAGQPTRKSSIVNTRIVHDIVNDAIL